MILWFLPALIGAILGALAYASVVWYRGRQVRDRLSHMTVRARALISSPASQPHARGSQVDCAVDAMDRLMRELAATREREDQVRGERKQLMQRLRTMSRRQLEYIGEGEELAARMESRPRLVTEKLREAMEFGKEITSQAMGAAQELRQGAEAQRHSSEHLERVTSFTGTLSAQSRNLLEMGEGLGARGKEIRDFLDELDKEGTQGEAWWRSFKQGSVQLAETMREVQEVSTACISGVEELQQEGEANLEVVARAADRMGETAKRAGEIGSIVEFMRGVADETNLLSLNAAIVAAQAGPEGRGFAVVAEEIRELSERMASSAKEIDQLVEALREGAEQAASSLREGVERSVRSKDLVQNTAASLGPLSKICGQSSSLAETLSDLDPRGAPDLGGLVQAASRALDATRGWVEDQEESIAVCRKMSETLEACERSVAELRNGLSQGRSAAERAYKQIERAHEGKSRWEGTPSADGDRWQGDMERLSALMSELQVGISELDRHLEENPRSSGGITPTPSESTDTVEDEETATAEGDGVEPKDLVPVSS